MMVVLAKKDLIKMLHFTIERRYYTVLLQFQKELLKLLLPFRLSSPTEEYDERRETTAEQPSVI
jgi:hypothetical protein